MVESWNGSTWSVVPSPNPSGSTYIIFNGISCFSATNCTAVGFSINGNTLQTLIESWDGTAWSITPSPNVSGSNSQLFGITCPSATGCIAVGKSDIGSLVESGLSVATDPYSYAAGGGTGSAPASGSGLDGTTITLAANPFTYPGYTFAGWSDGTTTYAAGAIYKLSSDGAAIIFTAQWTSLCAAGLHPHVLNATYAKGTFTGLFCVNDKGFGTYTQGALSGFGSVTTVNDSTVIGALGKNLALAGSTNGTKSSFVELAPTPIKFGTFTLSHTWIQLNPATSPPARRLASMAYDPASNGLVLFGGDSGGGADLNDTWVWQRGDWIEKTPAMSPSPRERAAMAYDAATGQLVLFGGGSGDSLNDTWLWNGRTWIQQHPADSPSPRSQASMVYDPATRQLLLFGGGFGPSIWYGDTWVWTGTTWKQLSPATSPSPRVGAAVTYDPITHQVVLFGGYANNGTEYNDTWTWSGTTWTNQTTTTGPSTRVDAALAFNPTIGKVVLFGGTIDDYAVLGDTWIWNGTTWTLTNPGTSPDPRGYAQFRVGWRNESTGPFWGLWV